MQPMRSRDLSSSSILLAGVLLSLVLTHCSESPPVEQSSRLETEAPSSTTFVGRQVADENTVLGDFDNATFTYNGITYTFGIEALQQYLIKLVPGNAMFRQLLAQLKAAQR